MPQQAWKAFPSSVRFQLSPVRAFPPAFPKLLLTLTVGISLSRSRVWIGQFEL